MNTEPKFCHLHVHDEFSALDGFGSPVTYAKRAKELGFKYLGITNHANVDSAIKFQNACKEQGIKPVIGCELYIDEDRRAKDGEAGRKHINVFVKNEAGWKNLLTMLTIANLEGFHKRPRIDPATLLKHCEGLIVATACTAGIMKSDWGMKLFKRLAEVMPDDLYLEIQPHEMPEQIEWNTRCLSLSNNFDIKLIATNDCHYPDADDSILQEILLAVSTGTDWDNPKRWKFDVDTLYLCSRRKMLSLFEKNHPYIGKQILETALSNTEELAERCCSFRIEKQKVHLPLIPEVCEGQEVDFFKRLIRKGFKQKIVGKFAEQEEQVYQERVDEEIELLVSKGFERYFLIVWELVNWCRKNNIMTGPGRGSVGGCLVAYLIDITLVDPIKYGLLFSRFISPDRNDLPDIDMDFERDRRDEVIQHIKHLYGDDNVIQISTYLTMKGKMALQDLGRTFGISRTEVSAITKIMDDEDDISAESFTEAKSGELRDFYTAHPDVVEYAVRMQNTVRGYGKHAAGVCISDRSLTTGDKCNLCNRNGSIVSNWDKDDSEYMGLMKLDILGLSALSRIHECLDLIEENHGKRIDLNSLSMEDEAVLADLSAGRTMGVFQLGTPGITRFCQDLGIETFKDVYNATALFRPGTLGSGMAKEFIERKHGKRWKAIHENVKALTADTYGIIVYQEQVMIMARELAGFSWGECDKLRKVIAKSKGAEEFNKFRDSFISGCIELKTLDKSSATKLFDDIVSFSKYAFNLSHSVEYSVLSIFDAWLKHYYPAEFFASNLSYASNDKKIEFLDYLVENGFKIVLPKTSKSDAVKWKCRDRELLMPFTEINGVGESQAKAIAQESKKKRTGFFASSSSQNLPAKVKQILSDIRANDLDYEFTYNELKKLKDYFQYNLPKILDL
jgi:DNA polymerase-3 subunit alpha